MSALQQQIAAAKLKKRSDSSSSKDQVMDASTAKEQQREAIKEPVKPVRVIVFSSYMHVHDATV